MKGIGRGFVSGVLMLWLVGVAASVMVAGGQESKTEITQPVETAVAEKDGYIINVLYEQNTLRLELEEYLVGVLLAELPGTFHAEAKKAVAVAARTVTVKMAEQGIKHGANTVCTDAACCQAYISEGDFLNDGGEPKYIQQAMNAVQSTEGQVLVYDEKLIDATYFSCSGGKTEDAVAVWGTDVPYLQSVDSPGEESARYYTDTIRFDSDEFQEALGISLSGPPSAWFGKIMHTDGGGVATIVIGQKTYSGIELRNLLGLRSASFTVTALSDAVLITTRGFGHRVGLSQYGADAMGRLGSSWLQILKHYYQDIKVTQMSSIGEIGG